METAEDQVSLLSSILVTSKDPNDLQSGTRKLLHLCSRVNVFPRPHIVSEISKKLLSDQNPSLRVLGLKIVRKMWTELAPSREDIISHYIQDIDPGVRVAALKGIQNSSNHLGITSYFSDIHDEVQIAAMRLFVKNSQTMDHDLILEKLIPQTFSNSSSVLLETLKLIGKLRLSIKAIQKSLTIDDKLPYSGFLLYVFESEFCDVRLGAIESISNVLNSILPLSYDQNYASVVYLVVKVLLDVINDEFREVRIMVFKFLSQLTPYFMLRKKPDVDSCIFNLRDADPVLRHAIYDFLCKVKIDNPAHAQTILETLFALFQTFPEDTDYIFSVSASMARQNHKHGKFLQNRLLGVDKRFLTNEHNWNDPVYIAKLIFIVNANSVGKHSELPISCEKHISYLSDLYPLHMPQPKGLGEMDLDLPQQGDSELLEKCRKLRKNINAMVQKPQIFYHNAELYVKSVLFDSCEIQNCYEIQSSSSVNEFVKAVRLQAHLIFLLSMLAHCYTGKRFPVVTIKQQIENIWKAAALTNNDELIKKCHDSYENPDENIYDLFKLSLQHVEFPKSSLIAKKKTGEVTFPTGEKLVNDCDMLSVQGHGSSGLYCVLELPDGSVESAKAYSHSTHLNSHIRIHRPNTPINAQLCFAVLLNLSDFTNGPGLYHETLSFPSYIPVSGYISLLLKPSN